MIGRLRPLRKTTRTARRPAKRFGEGSGRPGSGSGSGSGGAQLLGVGGQGLEGERMEAFAPMLIEMDVDRAAHPRLPEPAEMGGDAVDRLCVVRKGGVVLGDLVGHLDQVFGVHDRAPGLA